MRGTPPRRQDDGLSYILVGLGPRTDAVWLAGNVIGLGLTLSAAYFFPGHGLIFAYLAVTMRLALYTQAAGWPGGEYFDQMLRLGLVAGLFEIFADYVPVRLLVSGLLVYLTRDAVLLESPLYMPFAGRVIVGLGYVSCPVQPVPGRPGAPGPRLVGGLTAGAFIGSTSIFAFRAGWWKYEPRARDVAIPSLRCGILPSASASMSVPRGRCCRLDHWLGRCVTSAVAAGLQRGDCLCRHRDTPG
jgi:hypothetical protein